MPADSRCCRTIARLCALAALYAGAAHAQRIDTRAGGPVGDDGPAREAQLAPLDIAADAHGNVFVGEPYRVRKITPDGVIHTLAGTGMPADRYGCGVGIALTSALFAVQGIAVDAASGDVYLAVYENNCILRITADGLVLPVAGTGAIGFSGDGGPALAAQLDGPAGLVLDGAGALYFSDQFNQRVRKVDAFGTITTIAGTGEAAFGGDGAAATQAALFLPHGLALDGLGDLFIADSGNSAVRRIDAAGTISTVARGGFPLGVHIDASGALLMTDDFAVWRIDGAGDKQAIAGSPADFGFAGDGGPARDALLFQPGAVTTDAHGETLIADVGNGRVRRIDAHGDIDTIAGGARYPDDTPAARAALSRPNKIAVDRDGALLIGDGGNRRVRTLRPDGTVATVAGNGGPRSGVPLDGAALDTGLSDGTSIAADGRGGFYVGDGNALRHVDADGTIHTLLVGTLSAPCTTLNVDLSGARAAFPLWISALVVDAQGDVLLADVQCNTIRRLHGTTLATIAGDGTAGFGGDGGPATGAQLNQPMDIALDRSGNLYVADANNQRIRRIDASGTISTLAGNGEQGFGGDGGPAIRARFNVPHGVLADADGSVLVADTYNQVVRRIAPDGTITRLAGNYAWGFAGDDGDAASASLRWPVSLARSADGVLYIADQGNDRVRRVVFDDLFRAGFED